MLFSCCVQVGVCVCVCVSCMFLVRVRQQRIKITCEDGRKRFLCWAKSLLPEGDMTQIFKK